MHRKAYKNTQSTSLSKWDWNGSNLNGKEQFQNYGLTIKKECETKRYKGKTCCIIILMQIIGAHTLKIALQTSLKTSFVEWCFIYIGFEVFLKSYWIFCAFSILFHFWAYWQQSSKIHNYPFIFLDLTDFFNQFYTKDLLNFLDPLNHLDPKDLMALNLLYFYLLNLVFI